MNSVTIELMEPLLMKLTVSFYVKTQGKSLQHRKNIEFHLCAYVATLNKCKFYFQIIFCRNKVLTTEVKALKQQMATVLEKGRHDDELIAALMVKFTGFFLNQLCENRFLLFYFPIYSSNS